MSDLGDQILGLLDQAVGAIEAARPLVVELDDGEPEVPPEPEGPPEGVDLVVSAFVPPGLSRGQPAQLGATVTNAGDRAIAPGLIIGVGFYLDDDPTEVAWASTDAGLDAGGEVELSTATAPMHSGPFVPSVEGEHELTAFVDDFEAATGGRIPEWNEDNNEATRVVEIRAGAAPATGGRLFNDGSPWNTPKTGIKISAGADQFLRGCVFQMNASSYGHPIARSGAGDPVHTFHTPDSWGWPAGVVQARMPDSAVPAGGTDGHLCVLEGFTDGSSSRLLDFWQLHGGNRDWYCSAWAQHDWATGSGWGNPSPFQSAGVTASGAPTGGGTLTQRDLDAGIVDHALCMAFSWVDGGGNGTGGSGPWWPAIYSDMNHADGGGGPMQEAALLIASGPRPGQLNAAEGALWEALVTLGAYVVDKADPPGVGYFYAENPSVGSHYRGEALNAIGRTLRMVDTWS